MAESHYSADSARDPHLLLSAAGWLPPEARFEQVRRSTFLRANPFELCIAASGTAITKLG